jgi:hypothetical protein
MKRFVVMAVWILLFCFLAMGKDLEKGQLLLSTQAGVTSQNGSSFQLKLDSPISRSFSVGFSFEQRRYADKIYPYLNPDYVLVDDYAENLYLLTDRSAFRNSQSFCLEAAYHFTFIPVKRLDIFTGLGIGMDIDSGRSVWSAQNNDQGELAYKSSRSYDLSEKLFAGLDFFVTEKIGLGGRFSVHHNPWLGSVTSAMLGATFRLK